MCTFFKKNPLIRSGEILGISREVEERSRRGREEGEYGWRWMGLDKRGRREAETRVWWCLMFDGVGRGGEGREVSE